jgi:hypothetical protein
MPRHKVLDLIRTLDPEGDHQQIVYLMTAYEFPFDITRALEFALYRTFAVPSISALLDRTGEFTRHAQKRYDDTDLILSTIYEYGYDSERGRAALRRMNRLHGRFAIANDDYLYVLSTFVFEPIRWIDRYGWRRLVDQERLGMFQYWCAVGRRMNIAELPTNFSAFERYNREYEREHFRFSEANQRVGTATRDMFLGWFLPASVRRWGAPAIHALMDDALLAAFGFPQPSALVRRVVRNGLRTRSGVVRMLPARRRPRLRTERRHRTYPRGYRLDELGPREAGA